MAANRLDGSNLDGRWYPQTGRARGLLQALDRIRNQQTPPPDRGPGLPQMERGRGLPPSSPPQIGCGRARMRALLMEMTAQNSAKPPVQFPIH